MPVKKILEIKDLAKYFGGLRAIENVNLDIREGEIMGLIGPNGAGKTTLINCITGVYRPTRGEILFEGRPMVDLRPHQVCRAGIGRTFQIPRPFTNMTVLDNLRVCALHEEVDFRHLLEMVGLWDKREHLAKALTFQERRLLELSRALSVGPKLLLLDETMAGLNPAETLQMMALLRRIHERFKVSVLWIEHVMKAIMETAHRVVVLHQGVLIAQGRPQEIANDACVIEAYLGEEYLFSEGEARC